MSNWYRLGSKSSKFEKKVTFDFAKILKKNLKSKRNVTKWSSTPHFVSDCILVNFFDFNIGEGYYMERANKK